ncbi:hypothetical protein DFH06DRAFT_1146124 [Mycena polygramma]|nr:hypothetical protein DFH06DRAFT_1146124 [Mycena polygramma]
MSEQMAAQFWGAQTMQVAALRRAGLSDSAGFDRNRQRNRRRCFNLLENYDEFFDYVEDGYEDPASLPLSIHIAAKTSIIDFRSWKACAVVDDDWKQYYICRLHYHIVSDARTPECQLIFYRYLPKTQESQAAHFTNIEVSSFMDQSSSDNGNEDAVSLGVHNNFDLSLLDAPEDIRELYGPTCAPRPEQKYDILLGIETAPPYARGDRLSKFTKDLDAAVPATASSPEFSQAATHIDNVICCMRQSQEYVDTARDARGLQKSPPRAPKADLKASSAPLISRIGGPSSSSVTPALLTRLSSNLDHGPWTQRSRGRSPAQSRSQSSASRMPYHLRRSASPVQRARSSATPSSSRRESRDSSFSTHLPKGAYVRRESPVGLPRLLIPSASQQRNARWRNGEIRPSSNGSTTNPGNLTYPSSVNGILVLLAFFSSEQREFRKVREDQGERILGGSIYTTGRVEPPLNYSSGDSALAMEWQSRTLGIPTWPHARAFVSVGRVPAWLARTICPELIADFMSGPSIQSTTLQRGWTDTPDKESWDILADLVSVGEVDVLLGFTKDKHGLDRWLFPRTEWLWE